MQLTSSSGVPSGVLSAASRRLFHLCLLLVLTIAVSVPMWAQGGEEELKLPDLHTALFLDGAVSGPTLLLVGLAVSVLGMAFRSDDVHAPEKPACTCVHAGGFRTDLRDLQDVSDHTRPVPAGAGDVHRRDHRFLFRLSALTAHLRGSENHPGVQGSESESAAATAWPGSAFASIHLPTRARRSPACAASPIPAMRFRSRPA